MVCHYDQYSPLLEMLLTFLGFHSLNSPTGSCLQSWSATKSSSSVALKAALMTSTEKPPNSALILRQKVRVHSSVVRQLPFQPLSPTPHRIRGLRWLKNRVFFQHQKSQIRWRPSTVQTLCFSTLSSRWTRFLTLCIQPCGWNKPCLESGFMLGAGRVWD